MTELVRLMLLCDEWLLGVVMVLDDVTGEAWQKI